MKIVKIILICFLVICSLKAFCSEVIGSYANGCIAGAKPLQSGEYYQIQKWGKDRNYGHPSLLSFIKNLSVKAKKNKLPILLVGDLSSPVGGSFGPRSNHGSHQSGLDVDISFDFANPKKTEYELSHP
ncbi:penicillin-insensitive murein endopeptidase, partial [Succinivibrio sp.]|uniref:penicillin-insensitive murein endopeptidase n=1 Tax=Succinivibrio sp. TaxID=2053619 RepID=UPI00386B5A1A